jgi:hypothetical protein
MKQDLYFESKGEALSVFKVNGKETTQSAEWDVNYDGDLANIKLDTDTNGKKEHKKIKLTNDDINAMLSVPSHDLSLESRLETDFLSSPTIIISEEPAYLTTSSFVPISSRRSSSSKSSRKTSSRKTSSRKSLSGKSSRKTSSRTSGRKTSSGTSGRKTSSRKSKKAKR